MSTDASGNAGTVERLGPLAGVLEDIALPTCVRDAAGRYVAVNEAFAELVGLEPSRLVGKTDNALQPADVAHRVAELDALVLEAHGHLDAREVLLARDGRRTVRACRFPIYDAEEPWAICVVMAPGDDREAGRVQRESLQALLGQSATSGMAASPEELVAERERAAAADAEALAAREALAIEREARLEAEIQSRGAQEELERQADVLAGLRDEASRLGSERDDAAQRVEELERRIEAAGAGDAELRDELTGLTERCTSLEGALAEATQRSTALSAELEAAAQRSTHLTEELDATRRDSSGTESEIVAVRQRLDEAIASRDELASELAGIQERQALAAGELEQERERAERLAGELTAAQEALRVTEDAKAAAEERCQELERALSAAREHTDTLAAELDATRGAIAEAAAEAERTAAELDIARQTIAEAADEAERAAAELDIARQTIAEAADEAERAAAELEAERERAAAAKAERDAATQAHSLAGEALEHAQTRLVEIEAQAAEDRHNVAEQLTAVTRERDDLVAALAAERGAREAMERKLEEQAAAAAMAQPAIAAPSMPDTGSRPVSLPPLSVAAEQAKAFAHSAPVESQGPPPGLTADALEELDANLVQASSPRAAGRAAMQTIGTATGWQGGVLWQATEEGQFGCSETWTGHMSGLEAWETMAWRAHLEDGLVAAAAGSGEPHWADTEEMLACPRSRSAGWAGLATLVTVPVRHPDGRIVAVLELVRTARDEADPELLTTLAAVAVRLAERLATIDEELAEISPVGRI